MTDPTTDNPLSASGSTPHSLVQSLAYQDSSYQIHFVERTWNTGTSNWNGWGSVAAIGTAQSAPIKFTLVVEGTSSKRRASNHPLLDELTSPLMIFRTSTGRSHPTRESPRLRRKHEYMAPYLDVNWLRFAQCRQQRLDRDCTKHRVDRLFLRRQHRRQR